MKMFARLAVCASVAAFGSSSVFAQTQGKTRAEVYQELIEAQQNGLNFVTDASYPEVSPAFQGTVEYLKKQAQAKADASRTAKAASDAAGMPAN